MSANATTATGRGPIADDMNSGVRLWLMAIALLIAAMVIVGGATRLTDSGLSITEWRVIMGAIPPLSQADWDEAFALYKQIPEYQVINRGMSLDEFKTIFWWEWAHRFLGRFIGIAFLVPFVIFWMRGQVARPLFWRLCIVFLFGAAQGAMGWYMVMSGLVERTDVSQYRLAAHLSLAFALFGYIVWLLLDQKNDRRRVERSPWGSATILACGLVVLVFAQIVMGAFVAGLNAGYGYNTWPLMDGAIIPTGLGAIEPLWRNLFENALTVQFVHRMLAYAVILYALVMVWRLSRGPDRPVVLGAASHVLAAVAVQVGIGIATLLTHVQILVALLHQGVALVVLAAALRLVHVAYINPAVQK